MPGPAAWDSYFTEHGTAEAASAGAQQHCDCAAEARAAESPLPAFDAYPVESASDCLQEEMFTAEMTGTQACAAASVKPSRKLVCAATPVSSGCLLEGTTWTIESLDKRLFGAAAA